MSSVSSPNWQSFAHSITSFPDRVHQSILRFLDVQEIYTYCVLGRIGSQKETKTRFFSPLHLIREEMHPKKLQSLCNNAILTNRFALLIHLSHRIASSTAIQTETAFSYSTIVLQNLAAFAHRQKWKHVREILPYCEKKSVKTAFSQNYTASILLEAVSDKQSDLVQQIATAHIHVEQKFWKDAAILANHLKFPEIEDICIERSGGETHPWVLEIATIRLVGQRHLNLLRKIFPLYCLDSSSAPIPTVNKIAAGKIALEEVAKSSPELLAEFRQQIQNEPPTFAHALLDNNKS